MANRIATTARSAERSFSVAAMHEKMARNIFLNIELLLNDDIQGISEYDVQAFMFMHFSTVFRNSHFNAEREREGRVDCVVYYGGEPRVLYELKTYFKKSENLTQKNFDKDIDKMAVLLRRHRAARGYIMVSGTKGKFAQKFSARFPFVSRHLKENDRSWIPYKLGSGDNVNLRPSRKFHQGKSVLITWEVRAPKTTAT